MQEALHEVAETWKNAALLVEPMVDGSRDNRDACSLCAHDHRKVVSFFAVCVLERQGTSN
jgi:hypothetical protein